MTVAWHDVECGSYVADLELWENLADGAGDPVLELGCGTGRVALYLASRGHGIVGLDTDPELVQSFNERSGQRGLPATAEVADVRAFELDCRFHLALAPMQLVQLIGGPVERHECLRCVGGHLEPGGLLALAIVDSIPTAARAGPSPPVPDVHEIDGWVYSSLPIDASVDSGEIVVRRLRQTVSPQGDLSDELDEVRLCVLSAQELEREAVRAGLRPAGRREIVATEDHVGSIVVLLEAG